MIPTQPPTQQTLLAENAELRARLEEAEEMLHAIHSGEVDALVVESPAGPQVFTLQGLDAEVNRFRGEILEQVSDAVIVLDDNQYITYLNAAAEQQYGVIASQALGHHITKIYQCRWYHPGDEAAMLATLGKTGNWRGEKIHIKCNGETLHVEISMTRLSAGNGNYSGLLAVIRDITGRKQAEAEKEQTLELLDTLLRTAPIGFALLDRNLRYLRINDRLAEMNGIAAEAHIGRHVSEIVPSLGETLQKLTRRILKTNLPMHYQEFSGKTAASPGRTRYWNESWYPVHDSGGEIVGFGGVVEEITERKCAEEALRERDERLQLFIKHAPAGIAMFDREMRYLVTSNRWQQDYGLTGDVIGCSHYELFPDLPERWKDVHRRCLAGETLQADEDLFERADGSSQWLKWEARPWLNADGQVGGILIAAEEITERVLAKTALYKSETKLAAIVHQARAGLAETDVSGRFLLVNDQFCKMVARSREELLTLHWQDITHPEDLSKNETLFRLCITEDRPFEIEKRYLRPDGALIWASNTVSLLRDVNGLSNTALAVVFDVSTRRENEMQLREQALKLNEADRRKDEFLAMLAHELRNPLMPILNAVHILNSAGSKDSRIMWCSNIINRQAEHLTRMVSDLLEVSRIAQGKIELKIEPLTAEDIVLPAMETSRPLIEAREQELSLVLPTQPLWINGDLVRLTQVLSNLLNNASKFTAVGGQIGITVEECRDEVCIHVKDTGCGIESSKLPHLFELFYQVDGNLARSQGGLGIGLSLVHNLVKMHDGMVQADSKGLGQGSEFVVCLPMMKPAETVTDFTSTLTASINGELGILVVDDYHSAAESLAMLLEIKGHQVWIAHDGVSAIEMALDKQPRVVILDIGLPDMDGFELATKLRQSTQLGEMLIIALSGYAPPTNPINVSPAGFDEYLVKPVKVEEIQKLLDKISGG